MADDAETLYCPFCNALGSIQPKLSPLVMTKVEDKSPHYYSYGCELCGYVEYHDKIVVKE